MKAFWVPFPGYSQEKGPETRSDSLTMMNIPVKNQQVELKGGQKWGSPVKN